MMTVLFDAAELPEGDIATLMDGALAHLEAGLAL
jgi:hypothetical protein